MSEQLRRYFVGLVGFAFVACWLALGFLSALAALALCVALVNSPALASTWANKRRPVARQRRNDRTRPRMPLPEHEEELPLVPDDPSLILDLSAVR